ncbi:hypothetical protein [uncultured Enterovirga sp.]|uniref:hypothetical protein n=1 Tax=uncultured Enterovirga sp. TaxID=2026352 RepID=UPI0035CB74FB
MAVSQTSLIFHADRAGPFLVLKADDELDGFLAVPLYTGEGLDGVRMELDENEKDGAGSGWQGRTSYWHTKHFWIIPRACFPIASRTEMNPASDRKRYATDRLAEIIAHRDDSEISFRSPISK